MKIIFLLIIMKFLHLSKLVDKVSHIIDDENCNNIHHNDFSSMVSVTNVPDDSSEVCHFLN